MLAHLAQELADVARKDLRRRGYKWILVARNAAGEVVFCHALAGRDVVNHLLEAHEGCSAELHFIGPGSQPDPSGEPCLAADAATLLRALADGCEFESRTHDSVPVEQIGETVPA